MTPAAPGRVLRLALAGWGLGHVALGRRRLGPGLMLAEAVALVAVAALTVLFAETSWYLLPFLAGCGFLVAWAWQAVHAYRAAQRSQGATPPTPARSPAAAVAWLTLPLLAWGVGFWLIAATAATPAAVVDRFVAGWTGAQQTAWSDDLAIESADLATAAAAATAALERLCAEGLIRPGCVEGAPDLYRDLRFRVELASPSSALAIGEAVRYETRPSRFLGLFEGRETVPVPIEQIILLHLRAEPAVADAVRWRIVEAAGG